MSKINVVLYINLILYWVAKVLPKKKNIWIFSAWFGEKYSDNPKYLYEYIIKNHPEINAIWVSKDPEIVKYLKNKGYKAYKKYSFISILYGLFAKVSVFAHSNSNDSFLFLNNGKTKLIQLFHGIPLKKVGADNNTFVKNDNNTLVETFPFLLENYDLFTTCSEEDKRSFSTAFTSRKFVITGAPRNDTLVTKTKTKRKSIVYLPTFRDQINSKVDLFSNYAFDFEQWQTYLEENEIILYIKMHPVNMPPESLIEKFLMYENIKFIDEDDIYENLLIEADILITDYSSVYLDFLLTDRPIIFSSFDYEKYITKDRELYYNYEEVTPGPKCSNWKEVLNWVSKFDNNQNMYVEERKKMKEKFHKYQDGNASFRIYKEISTLINHSHGTTERNIV